MEFPSRGTEACEGFMAQNLPLLVAIPKETANQLIDLVDMAHATDYEDVGFEFKDYWDSSAIVRGVLHEQVNDLENNDPGIIFSVLPSEIEAFEVISSKSPFMNSQPDLKLRMDGAVKQLKGAYEFELEKVRPTLFVENDGRRAVEEFERILESDEEVVSFPISSRSLELISLTYQMYLEVFREGEPDESDEEKLKTLALILDQCERQDKENSTLKLTTGQVNLVNEAMLEIIDTDPDNSSLHAGLISFNLAFVSMGGRRTESFNEYSRRESFLLD